MNMELKERVQAGRLDQIPPAVCESTRMTSRMKGMTCLVAMAWLAGCATPTAYQRADVAVPTQWQQGSDAAAAQSGQPPEITAAALSPWWLALGDSTLTRLIQDALARNNDLAQAAIKVRRAQLLAGQAASDQLPTVNVKGSTSAARQIDGGPTTQAHSVTGSVSWEVDLWGRLARLRDVADWRLGMARASGRKRP